VKVEAVGHLEIFVEICFQDVAAHGDMLEIRGFLLDTRAWSYLEISPITTGPWRLMDMLEKMQTWRQHIHD
jgi:hypothetical protein